MHAQTGTMCNNVKTQCDIRQFFERTNTGPTFMKPKQENISLEEEKFDKMRMMRNKMVETRRIEDRNLAEKCRLIETPLIWEGEGIVYARDVSNSMVQDRSQVVVVGTDVEALYPN